MADTIKTKGVLKLKPGTLLTPSAKVDSISRYYISQHGLEEHIGSYSIRLMFESGGEKVVETDRELKRVLSEEHMFYSIRGVAFSIANNKMFYIGKFNRSIALNRFDANDDIEEGLYLIDDMGVEDGN